MKAQRLLTLATMALLAVPVHAADRWAVVIGIDGYRTLGPLATCRNDARAFARALTEQGGYDCESVLLITDDTEERPTLATLRRRIAQVAELASPGDTVLVYFSGHGLMRDGKGYLVPIDGDARNAVALSWVRDTLSASRALAKILVLDSCHAGSAFKGVAGIAPSLVAGEGDLVMLLSSAADQFSYPAEAGDRSVFSEELVRGLTGAADADNNREVTAAELFAYVRESMKRWSFRTGKTQTPVAYPVAPPDVLLVRIPDEPTLRVPEGFRAKEGTKAEPYSNTGYAKQVIHEKTGIEMVFIPAGEFRMGSNSGSSDEKPVHTVKITRPFYMGKYEVTQGEWQRVMGTNPSHFKGDRSPVELVGWEKCQAFAAKAGDGLGLPTEAEWEYACRAGTATAYSFGDDASDLGRYAWYDSNSGDKTHPVGGKLPNAWGLFDMHGNVWEWCSDWLHESYYARSPTDDPQGPSSCSWRSWRVHRGGSCYSERQVCRSATRSTPPDPAMATSGAGFRVARGL